MTREIKEITHVPNETVKITIKRENGDEVNITVSTWLEQHRVTAQWGVMSIEDLLPTNEGVSAATAGRETAHEQINNLLADLDIPDDVRQTIDRLERVGYWMDEQDRLKPSEAVVDVLDPYKSFRDQDILLVQAEGELEADRHTPFVTVRNGRNDAELRSHLDNVVERRTLRTVHDSQQRRHIETIDWGVTADITPVESLEEAAAIVLGDQGDDCDADGSDDGQVTLADY